MTTPKTIPISLAQAEAARLLVEVADKWGSLCRRGFGRWPSP